MATVNQLDSYFVNLINSLMTIERQPLTRLEEKRSQLNVSVGVYQDARSKLVELQNAVYALQSNAYTSALRAGRSVSISDRPSGSTVLTATASSSAVVGIYQITDIVLAKAHRIRSDAVSYIDQPLGLSTGSGYIVLGGAETRSVALDRSITDTVTAASTGEIDSGKKELGRGTYSIEVRQDDVEGWQFRLVDSSGKAVSIRNGTSTTETTSGWQAIPVGGGSFDTGRGLVIQFGDGSGYQEGTIANGTAAQVTYISQGARITVDVEDSLLDIVESINSATYAENDGVTASIIDNQLVLSAATTGTAYALNSTNVIDNGSGGTSGVLHQLGLLAEGSTAFKYAAVQAASDASFKVNGLTVTRSKNAGLTDVIAGVTINLAADAEGKTATITVEKDLSSAKTAINTFIEKFNAVVSYLDQKTAVTSVDERTYTRGVLADDMVFSELRLRLYSLFMDEYTNSSSYSSLRKIGLSLNDSLQATIFDQAKLDAALNNDLEGVQALLDEVMQSLDVELGRFTGTRSTTSYINEAVSLLNSQITDLNADITRMNTYLSERELYLTDQYAQIQAQLVSLTYMRQMWSSIYGTVNQLI
ncbi:MAG: Flagellar hook-associated protein FliD [Anaerolineae bacterium]|nr:MAG: Flagellar hook-associated protein FliD [Anaerolineae bacterium]